MAADKVELGAVLASLAKTGRLDKGDKRWISLKIEEQNKQEKTLALFKALETNQDLPLIIMFLGGAAAASIIELIKKIEASQTEEEKKTLLQQLAGVSEDVLDIGSFLSGGLLGWAAQELIVGQKLKELHEGNPPKNWVDYAANTASSLSIGVSAFAASLLVLRAIFGNSSKDGGMQSLAGLAGIL